MFKDKYFKKEKGAVLFISVIILTIFLAIVFGLSTILVGQIRIIGGMGDSVVAFYAADSGIERLLLNRETPPLGVSPVRNLPNGASYQVTVISREEIGCLDPLVPNFCVTSIGTYRGVSRAIEIVY